MATHMSDTSNPDIGLQIAIVLISALVGLVTVPLFSSTYNAAYTGLLAGALAGILILLTVSYASNVRKHTTVAMIALILVGMLSVAVPVHADYTLGWQFDQTGRGCIGTCVTEPCQTLRVSDSSGGLSNLKICAGFVAKIYKDTSSTSQTSDNYFLQMETWAMNGTNGSCFDSLGLCNYPIVATSLYNNRIGISVPSGISGFGPGAGCNSVESPVSPTFSGVTINLLLPAECTSWNSSPNYNWNVTIPSTSICWLGLSCQPNVLADNGAYADFYVEISVAKAASFTATFSSQITLTYCVAPPLPPGCKDNPGAWLNAIYNLSGSLYVDPSSQPPQPFAMTENPSSFTICQGQYAKGGTGVTSINGFGGWVSTTFTSSPPGLTVWDSYDPLYVTPSQTYAGSQLNIEAGIMSTGQSAPAGNYVITVTGTSGPLSSTVHISVTVSLAPYGTNCPPVGGSGGSVAAGTLITMADGSRVPIQNVRVGDRMLGYDTSTSKFTVSTVEKAWTVNTDNMLIISTHSGTPYRTDANPHQKLYLKALNGTVGWFSVTNVQVGDELFTAEGWVGVTRIQAVTSGTFVMYDMIATGPYFASGYLDPALKT